MIPLEYLLKMSLYYVEFNGMHVKTRVVAECSLIKQALKELKESLSSLVSSNRFVGIDVITSSPSDILVLQTQNVCFIFNLNNIIDFVDDLSTFLHDKTICFVGLDTIKSFFYVKRACRWATTSIQMVKLGELAGRILKKPNLLDSCNLEVIAKEIGHGVKVPNCPSGLLKTEGSIKLVYSPEEVKAMMCKAYACWLFADKLFAILSEVSADPARKRPRLNLHEGSVN